MSIQKATHDSWKIEPMPDEKTQIPLNRTFSEMEYERLQMGYIPRKMEEKWFIYLEDGWLFFHRSWTGVCVYQLRLEQSGSYYKVAEAWVNKKLSQSQDDTKKEKDVSLSLSLIDRFLLDRKV